MNDRQTLTGSTMVEIACGSQILLNSDCYNFAFYHGKVILSCPYPSFMEILQYLVIHHDILFGFFLTSSYNIALYRQESFLARA